MQLLIFAMLAFVVLVRLKLYPPEIPSVVLNSDWFYRRLAPAILRPILGGAFAVWNMFADRVLALWSYGLDQLERVMHSPITGPVVPGRAVMIQALLLAVILGIGYVLAA